MSRTITVTILKVVTFDDPPSTLLEYEVHNDSGRPAWLVDDGWLIWRREGREIELSYARGAMQPGSQVFGYFDPEVVELAPGARVVRTARLTWPHALDRLWNAEREAAPEPGRYNVRVRVGYGATPKPPAAELGEGVEAPVLRWQREAVSAPVEMRVPEHSRSTR